MLTHFPHVSHLGLVVALPTCSYKPRLPSPVIRLSGCVGNVFSGGFVVFLFLSILGFNIVPAVSAVTSVCLFFFFTLSSIRELLNPSVLLYCYVHLPVSS